MTLFFFSANGHLDKSDGSFILYSFLLLLNLTDVRKKKGEYR